MGDKMFVHSNVTGCALRRESGAAGHKDQLECGARAFVHRFGLSFKLISC